MKKFATAFLAGVAMTFALSAVAVAKDKTIAVSWKIFQEERWKTDEAAIKAVVEAAGDKYVSVDAQGSAAKQATDIEGLVTQKVDVIMVVAYDSDAILPSFKAASDAGVRRIDRVRATHRGRELVQFPGRALEDRRGRDQGGR